ncbi:MAG: pilus assembly protein TadG-related protein, partial [Chloroflexota bacterium]
MMLRRILDHIVNRQFRLLRAQKGQSLIIVTFAFLGLIAMLGLALDLGMVYIEQVRISRTTDAAALAAVVELPYEEEAMRRAIEYIELNGYDVGQDTQVLVRGCVDVSGVLWNVNASGTLPVDETVPITPTNVITDGYPYPVTVPNPRAIFIIDTLSYQPADDTTENQDNCKTDTVYGTANKLRVAGRVNVNMNFMQFFGFGEVPVQDEAVGENVTNLDIAVVFDVSGSMNFETTCFDCWEETTNDIINYPFPKNGVYNPLPDATTSDLCTASASPVVDTNSKRYLVLEAELYSQDVPLQGWRLDRHSPGQGFWVLQRVSAGASGADARGAYIRSHPLTAYSQSNTAYFPQLQGGSYNGDCFDGPNQNTSNCWDSTAAYAAGERYPAGIVPWVEYDFKLPAGWTGSDTHIWIRAQGGGSYAYQWKGNSPTSHSAWRQAIYWQVGRHDTNSWSDVTGGAYTNLENGDNNNPLSANWRWVKLGSISTPNAVTYTLRLYQGSTGFNVDKIILTDNSTGQINTTVDNSGTVLGGGSG